MGREAAPPIANQNPTLACTLEGPWLVDLFARGFQHPNEGIVGEVLDLLTTAQFARPGADQLMVMAEEAFVSSHGKCRQGGR